MKKILIVEDVEFNIDLLIQLLEDNYEVIVARDGESGLALADQEQPHLILMDIRLPKLDGLEVTRRLKAHEDLKHIPIIVLTASAMTGDEERATEAGGDDYLTKPLDEDLLFEKIAYFIGE